MKPFLSVDFCIFPVHDQDQPVQEKPGMGTICLKLKAKCFLKIPDLHFPQKKQFNPLSHRRLRGYPV